MSLENLETILQTTPAGRQTIADVDTLKTSGYSFDIKLLSTDQLLQKNGHSGGAFDRIQQTITIFINNILSENDQAHVVAHEMVHVLDDLEIDQVLTEHLNIELAVENFLQNYKKQKLSSFDKNVVSYVIGTLFCSESRAYQRNQILNEQGLTSVNFSHDDIANFIDENYIFSFGTKYGAKAEAMNSWCLSKGSMTEIQKTLIW